MLCENRIPLATQRSWIRDRRILTPVLRPAAGAKRWMTLANALEFFILGWPLYQNFEWLVRHALVHEIFSMPAESSIQETVELVFEEDEFLPARSGSDTSGAVRFDISVNVDAPLKAFRQNLMALIENRSASIAEAPCLTDILNNRHFSGHLSADQREQFNLSVAAAESLIENA